MCFCAMHFRDPNHLSGRPILARNVYFDATLRPQLQCCRAHFLHFYTQWLTQENCQVSAFYRIPVKFGIWFKMAKSPICPAIAQSSNFAGMQLKFDWTDLHKFFTQYSVVDSPSAIWVTPYPTQIFLRVKFRFIDCHF